MKLFGININVGKIAGEVAKVAAPVVIGALLTKRSVKAVAIDAAKTELKKHL